jgi:hypothetical protein
MHHAGGQWLVAGGWWLVGIVGLIIVIAGVGLVVEGVHRKFLKYLQQVQMSPRTRRIVERFGAIGTAARGAVFALTGVLVIEAAVTYQPAKAGGIDKALLTPRNQPFGEFLLILAALGLVIFGIYGRSSGALGWRGCASLELHPVRQVTPCDENAAFIAFGRAEFLRINVVDAIRRAVAAAIGMGGHRYRFLGAQPRHDMQLAYLAEAGPYRHLVAHWQGPLLLHVPIMPDEVAAGREGFGSALTLPLTLDLDLESFECAEFY